MTRPSSLLQQVRATCVPFCLLTPLCLSLAVGCSSTLPVRRLLEFEVPSRTNQNSPVPLALVAINDPKLFERVSHMTAKQWFEQREQIRRDYPGEQAFKELDWECVPGVRLPSVIVELEGERGTFLFANYRSSGDHRTLLPEHQRLRIEVAPEKLTLDPLSAPSN